MSGTKINILDDLPANGRFHILVFSGVVPESKDGLTKLNNMLSSGASPLKQYAQAVDLYYFHALPHLEYDVTKFPPIFSEICGKIYEDVSGKVHRDLGISVDEGAVTVIRPDAYVGLVTDLAGKGVAEYFQRILVH